MKFKNLFLLVLLSPLVLNAQWSNSANENTPVCTYPGAQYYLQAISDQADGAFLVWRDYRDEESTQLFISHLDADGFTPWGADGIPLNPQPYFPYPPLIIKNGEGGVFVACIEDYEVSHLFLTSISATGAPVWSEGPLEFAIRDLEAYSLNMLPDGQGGAILSWIEAIYTEMEIIKVQRISPNRELMWDSLGVQITPPSYGFYSHALQTDGKGGAWVVGIQDFSFYTNQLLLQKVDFTGNPQFDSFGITISNSYNSSESPTLVPDNEQGLYLVWEEGYKILAQHVTVSGTVDWDTAGIAVCPANSSQTYPKAIPDGTNGIFVVWNDTRNNTNGIYAQRLDQNGNRLWAEEGISLKHTTGFIGNAEMVSDQENGVIICFEDYTPTEVSDLYAQRINADGEILWDTDGLVVCNAPESQDQIQLIPHQEHGAMVIWGDRRNEGDDIYAQLINRQGFLGIDSFPPTATSVPEARVEERNPARITATCTDFLSGVNLATLNYRQGGDVNFNQLEMTLVQDSLFEAMIPGTEVTNRGLQYFIEVQDRAGNESQSPFYSIQVSTDGISAPTPTPAAAYQMVSLPLHVEDGSPAAVLRDNLGTYDIKKWRLFQWYRQENRYLEFGEEGFGAFMPGNGFWLITKEAVTIDTGPGVSLDLSNNHYIMLLEGWSIVSNPFPFPVAWADVEKYGTSSSIWEYTGTEYQAATYLEPWKGYFLYGYHNESSIGIPPYTASALEKTVREPKFVSGENDWILKITAHTEKFSDAANYVGALEKAGFEWDSLEEFEAPIPPGEFISLYFPQNNWEKFPGKYCTDFRPPAQQGYVWNFEVSTNLSRSSVNLQIEGIEKLPSQFKVFLFDLKKGKRVDIGKNPAYRYISQAASQKFQLVVGTNEFFDSQSAASALLPDHFELMQNYPNPFNAHTQIQYLLPRASQVELVIYNLMGQEIKSLVSNETQEAGVQQITWNGTDNFGLPAASGIYYFKLKINENEFQQIRKLVLIK